MTTSHRFVLAGVMGWPIAHSRSPKIHNYWFAQYGIDGCYAPLPVEPGRLEAALRAMPALGFAGCNLTIPHKETAIRFLDRVDESAARIGAVNCVVVEKNGGLTGRNYDGYGFVASLREAAPSWRAEIAPCVVIGAGGGARAIVDGLLEAGVREIRLFNRTLARAESLAADFGPRVSALAWEEREAGLAGAGLRRQRDEPGNDRPTAAPSLARRTAEIGARRRYRLRAAGNAFIGRRARTWRNAGRRTWHAVASGAPGVPRLDRGHAGSNADAARDNCRDAVKEGASQFSLRRC